MGWLSNVFCPPLGLGVSLQSRAYGGRKDQRNVLLSRFAYGNLIFSPAEGLNNAASCPSGRRAAGCECRGPDSGPGVPPWSMWGGVVESRRGRRAKRSAASLLVSCLWDQVKYDVSPPLSNHLVVLAEVLLEELSHTSCPPLGLGVSLLAGCLLVMLTCCTLQV